MLREAAENKLLVGLFLEDRLKITFRRHDVIVPEEPTNIVNDIHESERKLMQTNTTVY